ncbi:MAG TPA: Mov34/MPN/PAD-1 family protein [Gemmatimonadaceae bacterium]
MASPIPPRQPIPLERSIRWVPAGWRADDIEDHAIFITQDALRQIGDHARTRPGDEVLGFLLGERYECPDTGTRYVVITTVVGTGHVIAESDLVQIPDEEWLGIQLEVRRRHLTLVGWYHTAPFVAPRPARLDLDTQRARFTEPWQCGLVIATGERAAGGFFRAWDDTTHASTEAGDALATVPDGAFVPFHEMLDDAALRPGTAPHTLIDWRNYVTDIDVDIDRDALHASVASAAATPTPSGPTTPVLFPTGWDGDDTSALAPRPPRRTPRARRRWPTFLALIVIVAIAAWSLWTRGAFDRYAVNDSTSDSAHPRTSAGAPRTSSPASRTSSTASGDVRSAQRAPGTATSPGAPPSSTSPSSSSPATGAPSPTSTSMPASSSAALTNPSLIRFNRLADSLQQATVNYHTRRSDFDLHRIDCTGLALGYRAADDALVALAALYRQVHGQLTGAQIARFQALGTSLDSVNADFDRSGCPRP